MRISPGNIKITEVDNSDIVAVHHLLSEARDIAPKPSVDMALRDVENFIDHMDGNLDNPLGLEVLRADGDIVALTHSTWFMSSRTASLNALAVDREVRGRGLGKIALDKFLISVEALDCSEVCLCVRKGNRPAHRLYESRGFEVDPLAEDGGSYDTMRRKY